MATTEANHFKRFTPPRKTCGYRIDPSMPLHQLFIDRYHKGRDLKVIITSNDSETGTGKTTLAFWLADQWQQMFANEPWQAEKHATLDVYDYLDKYRNLSPGSVLLLDEAEELDARRSMAGKNVDFSHYWMKMRVRQVTTLLTLPGKSALDSRLMELADVWIEVQRRGKALAHDIRVNSYNGKVQTWQVQNVQWPNVADHVEMEKLDEMKQIDIDQEIQRDEEEQSTPDPKDVERQQKIEVAQRARDNGMTCVETSEIVDMSKGWVVENTETPE